MELKELIKGIDYIKIEGVQNRDIEAMYYDSREVTPDSLFFCIKGLTVDGHDFAPQAVAKGAKVLVLERDVEVGEDITKVFVPDTKTAMAYMAKNFYRNPTQNINFIGVTGTNGKTTVTYLVKSILEKAGHKEA